MGVAIGSSIQIALLVTPFLVMVGWAIGKPMSLHFELFETVAFALSVLIVTYVVQDGKSNYLEGAMVSPQEPPRVPFSANLAKVAGSVPDNCVGFLRHAFFGARQGWPERVLGATYTRTVTRLWRGIAIDRFPCESFPEFQCVLY